MGLKSAAFAASQGIRDAYNDRPPLKLGAKGSSVRMLQSALIEYGMQLPVSRSKHGRPDGIFGQETLQAVLGFQAGNGIVADGIVGKRTIQALDDFLSGRVNALSAAKVPRNVTAWRYYTIGTGDPTIPIEPSAGMWNSSPKLPLFVELKQQMKESAVPAVRMALGRDAADHLAHYLDGWGMRYRINLEGMLASVPSAMARLEQEVEQAQKFVESLDAGTYDITSKGSQNCANKKEEGRNWYYAMDWYESWGKGRASVTDGMFGREYMLDFEYHIHDRYRWNYGEALTFAHVLITDGYMGELHRQGLAREFDCVGSVRRKLTWRKLQPPSRQQLTTPAGGPIS